MKKRRIFTGLAFALLGAFVLLNDLGKPRVAELHGSDVLRIVASGFGFGIAFAILVDLPNAVLSGRRKPKQ